ncbi:hypothetical protein RCJ96_06090 [Bacillus sp. BSL6]|uniref:hypothetical protein n=1 Tax=Bacillus TaxID=1386 RepID=UPI00225C2CEB|nr:hypothetical protein [Bacillus pacificus]MBL3821381.1 hypothetical protein [Bacillus cereus]MCX3302054.1 hypothetical protein [Bacillus pacificus]MCX3329642.1 hypothetical protein [Bacillus pacificus]
MGAYDTPTKECPYCKEEMEADFVDIGIGMQQCGPYHCQVCGASEIGPELYDWYYQDREGRTLYLTGKRRYYIWAKKKYKFSGNPVLKPGHPFSKTELETGYYQGRISPYANTVNGMLVDHVTAKSAYNLGLLDEKGVN